MGWEARGRGRYYYRHVRVGGKARRVYLGAGADGAVHAALDRLAREAADAAAAARRTELTRFADLDRQWSALWAWARRLAAAALLAAGFYQHRGQWRMAMAPSRTRHTKPRPATPAEAADLKARLDDLAARANAGDAAAVAGLRAFLDDHPEVWRTVGDTARASVELWAGHLAGKDVLGREAVARFARELGRELAGDYATPTERALADVAMVARLALAHAEAGVVAGGPPPLAAVRNRRLDAATHRLAATLKLLAQVQAAAPARQAPEPGSVRLYAPGGEGRVG